MAQVKIEIPSIQVQVSGPIAVGTGFRHGLVQRTVARDAAGLIYIPGSTLKGRTRRACEQLAQQYDLRVCGAPRLEIMCGTHRPACLVCRTFGTPGQSQPAQGSHLRWCDAHLVKPLRDALGKTDQSYTRTQVQMSRALGTAATGHLYTSEVAVEELSFEFSITGWLEATPIAGDISGGGYELMLLLAGLRLVNTLGGGNSRGIGHCAIAIGDVNVDGQKLKLAQVLDCYDLLQEFEREVQDGH